MATPLRTFQLRFPLAVPENLCPTGMTIATQDNGKAKLQMPSDAVERTLITKISQSNSWENQIAREKPFN